MSPNVRLGMLTPSSNTVLEPMTYKILAGLPNVSAHFARFKVVAISLDQQYLNQFEEDVILEAAERLAEARVDVIAWNGTSSSWLGFDRDVRLCERITQVTGIPATTSMLALNEVLRDTGVSQYAMVTPYLEDVQSKIVSSYTRLGLTCVAEAHFGLQENFAFATVEEDRIRRSILEVAEAKPEAIAIVCTNLRAAQLAASLEAEIGIPVYDSVSTAVWKSLQIAGVPTDLVTGWGRLFQHAPRGAKTAA
jgi:maleate isomerase